MRTSSLRLCVASLLGLFVAALFDPAVALAGGPGGAPLIGFGQAILDFLTGPLAVIVFGLGLVIAAFSLILGSREGLMKAGFAILGGGLLFGVHTVINFVQQAAR